MSLEGVRGGGLLARDLRVPSVALGVVFPAGDGIRRAIRFTLQLSSIGTGDVAIGPGLVDIALGLGRAVMASLGFVLRRLLFAFFGQSR